MIFWSMVMIIESFCHVSRLWPLLAGGGGRKIGKGARGERRKRGEFRGNCGRKEIE